MLRYDISKGRPELEIAEMYFPQWCQYRRAFTEYRQLLDARRRFDPIVVIYDHTCLIDVYHFIDTSGHVCKIHYDDFYMGYQEIMHEYAQGRYEYIFIDFGYYRTWRQQMDLINPMSYDDWTRWEEAQRL